MFNLKRKVKEIVQSFEPVKDPQVVIAEIHNSFDTASEKLLNDAKAILAGSYDIEKGERLKKIGFVSTKKAVEAKEILDEKVKSKELAEIIEYYQFHYPNNKFITEALVKQICQKYGLLCGETQYYISDVPEKNLSEIENFNLRQDDMEKHQNNWYKYETSQHFGYYLPCPSETPGAKYGYKLSSRRLFGWGETLMQRPVDEKTYYTTPDLQICASVKDFDTKNMRIEDGYKLAQNLPDPIVLQPVKWGYLVVSKWGLEGDDELLVNEKLN